MALKRMGHDVHVVTTNVDGRGNSDVPLAQSVEMDGVKISYFPSRFLRRLYWSPQMKSALERTIKDYDLVHLHSVFLWPTWMAARIARKQRVPYVISPHGMLVKELFQNKRMFLKSVWERCFGRRMIGSASAVHVTAKKELDELKRFDFDLPAPWVVPIGIDKPKIDLCEDSEAFPDCKDFALFLGRISWKKGLNRLIEAWVNVPDVMLLIAGNDEESYRPELEQLAVESGVADRIRFVGMVQGALKWRLFRDAEVFILPSHSENFGISVLEAMSMGCPVVVTPEVGLAEAVSESGAGLVVDGDPDTLGREISMLLADSGRRRRMGENGKSLATTVYSWDRVADQMTNCYESIVVAHA
jgi:glycosyltransferase involved in cell wall biosynthesis